MESLVSLCCAHILRVIITLAPIIRCRVSESTLMFSPDRFGLAQSIQSVPVPKRAAVKTIERDASISVECARVSVGYGRVSFA